MLETAKQILKIFAQNGIEAYIVGGAVRDLQLGRLPDDIDIATGADPAQILKLAKAQGWSAVEVGASFGVVTLVTETAAFEVATFRTEEYGLDSHRPEQVRYVKTLQEDLARRDFTINAMALAVDGKLIDLFGGSEDLAAGIIRTVGEPDRRFAEDGLRMFRAARFAARFGFTIEAESYNAITRNRSRVRGLSVERVCKELAKTILSEKAGTGLDVLLRTGLLAETAVVRRDGKLSPVDILPELMHLHGLPQNPRHHRLDAWQHTLAALEAAPVKPVLRWAVLLHDVAKGWPGIRAAKASGEYTDHGHEKVGAELAEAILARLGLPADLTARVRWLVYQHMVLPPPERQAVHKWLRRLANDFKRARDFREAVRELLELQRADRCGGLVRPGFEELTAVVRLVEDIWRDLPFFPGELALSGGEIAAALGPGPQVGTFQANLLNRIHGGRLQPGRDSLLAALAARVRRLEG